MGPQMIWPIMATGVNVAFQEILTLTIVRHTVNSKMVTVWTKTVAIVRYRNA